MHQAIVFYIKAEIIKKTLIEKINLHYISWQAVILKPFKLEEYVFDFWKPPIFINLVAAGQGHSCILNALKSFVNGPRFIS